MYSIITFFCWGIADLFYKKGNASENEYNHLKTGIFVGLVMGLHATFYMIFKGLSLNFIELIKYLPVSLCYIVSMIVSYKGFKYIELSLASPIENTSGVITSLLLLLFFREKYPLVAYVAFFLVLIGIISISLLERKEERSTELKISKKKKISVLIVLFPIIYCILDGIGTFLDALYLDKFNIISEDSALLSYEYTFLIYAFFSYLYLNRKKEKIKINKEKDKILAAVLETAGQFFYVFAMARKPVLAAPMVASYCIVSVILSRIFLKEKLKASQYACVIAVIVGIVMMGIAEGLGEAE